MAENPFSVELAFFESHRAEFIERGEGKFVLIKGEELVDFFDTPETAYKTGVDRFGCPGSPGNGQPRVFLS